MENYCGSVRIKNPRTLQRWVDKGWYKEELDRGYIFSVGCGRFRKEVCTCSTCRKKSRPELRKILERNNL